MATYKDTDEILKEIFYQASRTSLGETTIPYLYWKNIVAIIKDSPTADVVPKSEVEYQKRKQEVMLLDAIDTFRNLLCIDSYVDYEDTRKHYAVSIDDVNRIHAELKKKYAEGKT